MKKFISIFLLVVISLVLVGCNKKEETKKEEKEEYVPANGTIVCKLNDFDDDGFVINSEINIEYKDKKITKLVSNNNFETKITTIDSTVDNLKKVANKLTDVEGIEFSASKASDTYYKTIVTIDYTQYSASKMKEAVGEDIDIIDPMYTVDAMSISEFKTNYLKNYTCK